MAVTMKVEEAAGHSAEQFRAARKRVRENQCKSEHAVTTGNRQQGTSMFVFSHAHGLRDSRSASAACAHFTGDVSPAKARA
jgi:hypothetical protein